MSFLPEIVYDGDIERWVTVEEYAASREDTTTNGYPFDTYVRPWDGEVVEIITGIPAKEYQQMNLPKKIKDTL